MVTERHPQTGTMVQTVHQFLAHLKEDINSPLMSAIPFEPLSQQLDLYPTQLTLRSLPAQEMALSMSNTTLTLHVSDK